MDDDRLLFVQYIHFTKRINKSLRLSKSYYSLYNYSCEVESWFTETSRSKYKMFKVLDILTNKMYSYVFSNEVIILGVQNEKTPEL